MNSDEVDFIDGFILSTSQIVPPNDSVYAQIVHAATKLGIYRWHHSDCDFHCSNSFIPIEFNAAIITSHN